MLLAVGFPVALILSWFFELTTDGLIRSADLAQHEEELRAFRRYLNPFIISMLSVAVVLFTLDKIGWISMLAKINSLSVTSGTSFIHYLDSNMSIPEISSELGVNYILEGAVQRDGDQIRVNAQLIDAGRDNHL